MRPTSRAQRRAERYEDLIAHNHKSTMENLYPGEIRNLRKNGYEVTMLSQVPNRKNFWLCEVIFPQSEPNK